MRSQFITIGWLLGSVVEVISWLLLLLLASPQDLVNMFQGTDPAASFSWPDKMIRDVIAVANTSGNTSHFLIENSAGNLSSDFHSLMEGRSFSDFKAAGGNQPYTDGSRGNNGSFTTVTLTYERSVLNVFGRHSIVELSYTFLGPDSISLRCFSNQDETKDDLCTVYDRSIRPWYRSGVFVENKVIAVMITPSSGFFSAASVNYDSSEAFWMNGSYTRDCPIIEKKYWSLDCEKSDPRRHLLYGDDDFAYTKQHIILIDSGNSMGAPVKDEFNRAPGTSYLDVAQEIAAEYSKTLPPEDKVNVFSFNASGAHPLQSQTFHGAPDLAMVKFPLSASIANADISPGTERSNLSTAILDVIPKFQLDKSSLNVVLVFSDGNFEPLSVYPKLLAALQIRVMLYILPHNSEPDQNMMLSTNLPLLSEANGYFEMLNATSIANPLYWIHGYFSYLSHFDSVLCKSESWGDMYFCVFKGTSPRTMSYRALGNDDMLVGVEGIDEKYEDITSELQMLLKHYVNEGAHDIELFQVVLRIHSCSHPIDKKYCKDCCYFPNIGLVSNTRTSSQISNVMCNFSECSLTSSNNNVTLFMKPSLKFILMFVVLGIIVVLIIRWIKQQNFVYLIYNKGSSASIIDNDLSSDSDLDGELNSNEIDPNASIFYRNRDTNIMLDSPSSRGSSGIVSKIMLFGVECAIKIFHPYARNDFRIEATTLMRLEYHPNIVEVYCAFRDFSIAMEHMDKDLDSFIAHERDHNKNYNLPLNVALEIMIQIAKGMKYLHECGIAHQDLKPKNILLKLEGQVYDRDFKVTSKVADFGSAQAFDPNSPEGLILFPHIHIGTRAWNAPELSHSKRSFFSFLFGIYPYVMLKPLDIYAFGLICYELIMGQLPIQASHSLRFPNGLVTLIEDCCHTNPLQRPKFDDICQRLLVLKSSLVLNE